MWFRLSVSFFATLGCTRRLESVGDVQSNRIQKDVDLNEFKMFGDCIGLSPIIFGKEGPYIQSDIQFAQQIRDDFRDFENRRLQKGEMIEDLSMDLMSRFFISESGKDLHELTIVASEIHLQLSSFL